MGAYLLAQAAPMIVSTGIWVVVVAVYPMMIVIGPVLGALALALRHTPPVLRVRFSVRPAVGRERALVLRALAAVPSLRGRGEPRIWVAPEPWDVIALGPRDLAVGAGVLDHVATDSSDPPLLARTAVSALAAQRLGAAAVRGLVDAYWLPWAMLKALGGRILDEFRLLSIWRVLWDWRPVLFGVAFVQQAAAGHGWLAVGLLGFAGLTYAAPAAKRSWLGVLSRIQRAAIRASNPRSGEGGATSHN